MAKETGCGWVEGVNLHFIASDASEWSFEGTLLGAATGAKPGSLWIDSDDDQIHYIDEFQEERYLPSAYEGGHGAHSDGATHTDVDALASSWVEADFIRYIRSETTGEEDYAHNDSSHNDQHSDTHADLVHLDSHSDQTGNHGDSHNDEAHSDHHTDTHTDVDDPPVHIDKHFDNHGDSPHDDSHDDSYSHNDSHSDRTHQDTHGDSHSDAGHGDQPVEIGI